MTIGRKKLMIYFDIFFPIIIIALLIGSIFYIRDNFAKERKEYSTTNLDLLEACLNANREHGFLVNIMALLDFLDHEAETTQTVAIYRLDTDDNLKLYIRSNQHLEFKGRFDFIYNEVMSAPYGDFTKFHKTTNNNDHTDYVNFRWVRTGIGDEKLLLLFIVNIDKVNFNDIYFIFYLIIMMVIIYNIYHRIVNKYILINALNKQRLDLIGKLSLKR